MSLRDRHERPTIMAGSGVQQPQDHQTQAIHASSTYDGALALVGAGTGARAAARLVVAAAALATTALVVRLLGADTFGFLAFGLSIVGLSNAISTGFGLAATRTVAARLASGDVQGAGEVTRGLVTVIMLGGGIGLVVLLAIITLTQDRLAPSLRVTLGGALGILLIGHSAGIAGGAVARGFGRVVLMEAAGVVEVVSKLVIVMVLFVIGVSRLGVVAAGYGLAGTAAAVAAAVVVRRLHPGNYSIFRPDGSAARWLIRIAGPYAVVVIATTLIQGLDVAVLGATHPGGPIGAYAPTLSLVQALIMLPSIMLAGMFLTAATRLIEHRDVSGFSRLYLIVSRISLLTAMPGFIVLAAAPADVLRLVFGSEFPADPVVVRVLLFGLFVTVAFGLNGEALIATGERSRLVRAFILPGITMVVSSLLLIPPFAARGAAGATAISFVVLNLSMARALFEIAGVYPFHRALVTLAVTAPLPVVAATVAYESNGGGIWIALAISSIAWVLWVVLVRLLGAFRFGELQGFVPAALRRRRE